MSQDLYGSIEEKKKKAGTESGKESSLRDWFGRKGEKGKKGGWVDCNTCRKDKKTGRTKCKACGREKGEKRSKYPACRPTPGACKERGRGKSWGKKTKKTKNEELYMDLERIIEEEIEAVITESYTKEHEEELRTIADELEGAVEMHASQAKRIQDILDETDDDELEEAVDPAVKLEQEYLETRSGAALQQLTKLAKLGKYDMNRLRKMMKPVKEEKKNCGCGQDPCETYGKNNEKLIIMVKEEIEAVLDEKKKKKKKSKGKKDACYHKVKSRYKVWPSAYASGALVKCRKVGAKNWGKSKKESIQIMIEDETAQLIRQIQERSFDPNLLEHIKTNTPLNENIFRVGSTSYFETISQGRHFYKKKLYNPVNEEEREMLENTNLGEWAVFEGERVPLDFPMFEDETLDETKKKDPPLNKPTRNTGSGKKYKVFVRNPKTGKIKKITYGDAKGGLKGGWNSAEARKSFAARHKCEEKKDRTKAGYWACRAHKDFGPGIGRFW